MFDESEAYSRLGLDDVNIASRGVKSHPGRLVGETSALLLFSMSKTGKTMAVLWDLADNQAITSETLDFPLGMLYDWDWRAEAVEAAFYRLDPSRDTAVEPIVTAAANFTAADRPTL